MVTTIGQALQPLSIATFIFGFGILRYPYDHPRIRLSFFYMLTMWSVYFYMFYNVTNYFSLKHFFEGVIESVLIIINMTVTIISVMTNFYRYKKLQMCIRKLNFVDNTLELLGTLKEYRRMRNSIKWIFITWFIMICTTWFLASLLYIGKYNDIRAIFIPIIRDYPLYINILMDIIHMFLLSYIGTRIDKINNHIEKLSNTEGYGLRCAWKKSLVVIHMRDAGNRKQILWTAMHLHSELCRIASNIHSIFEIRITLQMLCDFILLIAMFYFQYHKMLCLKQMYGSDLLRLKLSFFNDIWLIICLIKVISFNHICENVISKTRKTKDVIHKLTNLIYFTEAREEIFQFVLQISLCPLKFSGLGLYYFGYKYIHKFLMWILTAVVFMLQMDTFSISQIDRNNMTCY